jgi:hypothetical protein
MNWLAKTFRAFMPNCQEAIRLQSNALDCPLSPVQRIGLRLHLAMCRWCSRYAKQIKFLRTIARHRDHDYDPKQAMPSEARERIKRRLQTEINK